MSQFLTEWSSNIEKIEETSKIGEKSLFLKGICLQGDTRNANQRIYPMTEIIRGVTQLNSLIKNGESVLGELDHPSNLKISLDRVACEITEMYVQGTSGYGKLKICTTPCGNIVRALISDGVKLGVSSRGSGNVNESTGVVSDFELITVDIVAQPSAPGAYPMPVYESLLNAKYGHKILGLAEEISHDPRVQKFLEKELLRVINDLKLR
jgi:hypothetical protein